MDASVLYNDNPIFWRENLLNILAGLEWRLGQIREMRRSLSEICRAAVELKGQEFLFMFRNKFGLTKKDAKKLFYDYHSKDAKADEAEEAEGKEPIKPPETTDQKIAMIMDYMQETSIKLDRIESDIAALKEQVELILKRI
ncbi:MAG: hypothetical protein AB1656_25080 [Candidatus Omnitrophota bacterium]